MSALSSWTLKYSRDCEELIIPYFLVYLQFYRWRSPTFTADMIGFVKISLLFTHLLLFQPKVAQVHNFYFPGQPVSLGPPRIYWVCWGFSFVYTRLRNDPSTPWWQAKKRCFFKKLKCFCIFQNWNKIIWLKSQFLCITQEKPGDNAIIHFAPSSPV